MTLRRPAAGRSVGTGVLRVDARRAIAKLRDYQLAEPAAWVLEGIRAAVASGATRIDLQGDSNDVWLRWWGPPIEKEHLPCLLDALVSPTSARQGEEVRLLARAVNSALGLAPGHVDVFASHGQQKSVKVRYTPALLQTEHADDQLQRLNALEFEEGSMPGRAEDASMLIHVRRVLGWEPVRNFFRGQPLELALAIDSCQDLRIPITIGDREYGGHLNTTDLLRVPIGRGIEGYLALTLPAKGPASNLAQMQIAEHGVRVASYGVQVGGVHPRCQVPLRLVVDGKRMPTNASRSEVRRSAHPIDTVEAVTDELFVTLTWLIAQTLSATSTVEVKKKERVRAGALGLLASVISGTERLETPTRLPKAYRALARVPLFRNAVGDNKSLDDAWGKNLIHRGARPYAQEMRLWLGDALWIPPGDPTDLLGPFEADGSAFRVRLKTAKRRLHAQRRFEAHARRKPVFERLPRHWVHADLHAPIAESWTSDSKTAEQTEIEGQICLLKGGEGGVLRVLFDGREIEEVHVDSALPFAAIANSAQLSPGPEYRSVHRDDAFDTLVHLVRLSALRSVEAICLDGAPGFAQVEALATAERRQLARAGIAAASHLELDLDRASPLARECCFSLLDGTWASLDDLRQSSAIAITPSRASSAAPLSRTTVFCEDGTTAPLLRYAEPQVPVVFYDPNHVQPPADPAAALAEWLLASSNEGVALIVRAEGIEGAITWCSDAPSLSLFHRGTHLRTFAHASNIAVTQIAISSDALIPNRDWSDTRDTAGLDSMDYGPWEGALLQAVLLAFAGHKPPDLLTKSASEPGLAALHRALELLAKSQTVYAGVGEALYNRLPGIALFEVLGGERVTALELAERFPTTIDYLAAAPLSLPNPSGWTPLLASPAVAAFAARLAQRKLRLAQTDLEKRLAQSEWDARHKVHQRQPKVLAATWLERCPYVVEVSMPGASGLVGIAPFTKSPQLELLLLVDERPFRSSAKPAPLPLVACLELESSLIDNSFRGLRAGAEFCLRDLVLACGPRLLATALRLDPSAFLYDQNLRQFFVQWLAHEGHYPRLHDDLCAIREAARFPNQQGELISLATAVANGHLRVSQATGLPWLSSEDGEASDCDQPMVVLPEVLSDDLFAFLELLTAQPLQNLTKEARQLQLERRLERGLLIQPTVAVEDDFKRRLTDLGADGIGEIGFCDSDRAQARLWTEGSESHRLDLSLPLPIVVAIDDTDDLGRLARNGDSGELQVRLTALTHQLLREVLQTGVRIPEWLRISISRALLSGALDADEVAQLATVPCFITTAGTRVDWRTLLEQVELFGNLWYTEPGNSRLPLDERRIAIVLAAREQPTQFLARLPAVCALIELSLDEIARNNRPTEPIETLLLNAEQVSAAITSQTISEEEHGLTGIVAPLSPAQANQRRVLAYRDMSSVGVGADPCAWPTLAIIDDERLQPDRTWSAPKIDTSWFEACAAIRMTSESALSLRLAAPADCVASTWVGQELDSLHSNGNGLRVVLRGRLWLTSCSGPGSIEISSKDGETRHAATATLRGSPLALPIRGRLLCHADTSPDGATLVQELARLLYPQLLQHLSEADMVDEDVRVAHLAIGLATDNIGSEAIEQHSFAGFVGPALGAAGLATFLASSGPVVVGEPAPGQDAVGIRDNGTELSRALLRLTQDRRVLPGTIAKSLPQYDVDLSDLDTSEPEHALDGVATDLQARLARLGFGSSLHGVTVAPDRAAPTIRFQSPGLVLAGQCPLLRRLQVERLASSVLYRPALELLLCHAVRVLNESLTEVTDPAEHRALTEMLTFSVTAES